MIAQRVSIIIAWARVALSLLSNRAGAKRTAKLETRGTGEERVMETIVCHFWLIGPDGELTLYEQDYVRYPIREGVMCHSKVFNSERPCHCRQKEIHEQAASAMMN